MRKIPRATIQRFIDQYDDETQNDGLDGFQFHQSLEPLFGFKTYDADNKRISKSVIIIDEQKYMLFLLKYGSYDHI